MQPMKTQPHKYTYKNVNHTKNGAKTLFVKDTNNNIANLIKPLCMSSYASTLYRLVSKAKIR